MDDVTVYQCPECNFNADNLNELDSHMVEHHSMPTETTSKPGSQQQPAQQQSQQQNRLNPTSQTSSTTTNTVNAAAVSALIKNEIPTRAADRVSNGFNKEQVGNKKSHQIVTVNGDRHHNHHLNEDDVVDDDEPDDEDDEDFFNERSSHADKFNVSKQTLVYSKFILF